MIWLRSRRPTDKGIFKLSRGHGNFLRLPRSFCVQTFQTLTSLYNERSGDIQLSSLTYSI
jgi:hypothetical protein